MCQGWRRNVFECPGGPASEHAWRHYTSLPVCNSPGSPVARRIGAGWLACCQQTIACSIASGSTIAGRDLLLTICKTMVFSLILV